MKTHKIEQNHEVLKYSREKKEGGWGQCVIDKGEGHQGMIWCERITLCSSHQSRQKERQNCDYRHGIEKRADRRRGTSLKPEPRGVGSSRLRFGAGERKKKSVAGDYRTLAST